MNDPQQPRPGTIALSAGIVSALVSALITAALLLINGALVMVALGSVNAVTPPWMARDGILQFLLFSIPLVLVVIEWMIWDVLYEFFQRDGNA